MDQTRYDRSRVDKVDSCTTLNNNLAVTLLSADGQQMSLDYDQLDSIYI